MKTNSNLAEINNRVYEQLDDILNRMTKLCEEINQFNEDIDNYDKSPLYYPYEYLSCYLVSYKPELNKSLTKIAMLSKVLNDKETENKNV